MATIKTDMCVIGAGAAGLTVAAGASQLGASTVLIERDRMGGECLYTGCVPSKSLLAMASRGAGLTEAYDHMAKVIETIEPHDSQERFEGLGVRVIREDARFTGPRTLVAGGDTIEARRFVIATGSAPMVPPIEGLAETPFLTNETLFEHRPTPQHLLVLGGGPIGVEMSQAFRRLSAQVTLVEMRSILANDDPEAVGFVRERLILDGVEVLEQTEVRRVAQTQTGVSLTCVTNDVERSLEGSHVLVAAGRMPRTAGLDLDAAGIQAQNGAIVVDRGLRTTNRRIYAIGDVVGPYRFTHMAGYHARTVLRSALFRLPARVRHDAVPWVTFTDPELAHVGLTETEARRQGIACGVLRAAFDESDRAVAEDQPHGLIKAIVTPKGRVLGASIVGSHAGELVLPWSLAITRKFKVSVLAQAITPYPTLSETTGRVASSFYAPKLFTERTRRIVRLLARLG